MAIPPRLKCGAAASSWGLRPPEQSLQIDENDVSTKVTDTNEWMGVDGPAATNVATNGNDVATTTTPVMASAADNNVREGGPADGLESETKEINPTCDGLRGDHGGATTRGGGDTAVRFRPSVLVNLILLVLGWVSVNWDSGSPMTGGALASASSSASPGAASRNAAVGAAADASSTQRNRVLAGPGSQKVEKEKNRGDDAGELDGLIVEEDDLLMVEGEGIPNPDLSQGHRDGLREKGRELEQYKFDPGGTRRRGARRAGSNGGSRTAGEEFEEQDVIVVATVDGTMAGLSRKTGETLWKQSPVSGGKSNGGKGADNGVADGEGAESEEKGRIRPNQYRASDGETKGGGRIRKLLSPLVSTTTTSGSASSSAGKGGQDWRTAAVPSVDGRVYLTPGNDGSSSPPSASSRSSDHLAAQATASVRDLVSRAPFVDGRGRFYVGSRHSTAAALDRDTGEILRVVSGDSPQTAATDHFTSAAASGAGGDSNDDEGEKKAQPLPSLEGRNVVWVGRVDHSVSVYDARSGEVDVQFSAAEVLSVEDMIRGDSARDRRDGRLAYSPNSALSFHEQNGEKGSGRRPNGDTAPILLLPNGERAETGGGASSSSGSPFSAAASMSPLLVATPNGNVALRDPASGSIKWVASESFDSPVAFALESTSGTSVGVDIVPDAAVPSDSTEYLSRELERQIAEMDSIGTGSDGGGSGEIGDSIVGSLGSGQLFALPLGRGRMGVRGRSAMGGGEAVQKPYLPLGLPNPYTDSSTSSTKQWSKVAQMMGTAQPHHLQDPSAIPQHLGGGDLRQKSILPPPARVGGKKGTCVQSSASYPGCLVGSQGASGGPSFLESQPYDFAGRWDADNRKHGQPAYTGDGSNGQDQSRFRTFFRIMSSWIPPAVALAFVVSFELGRRERVKAEGRNDPAWLMSKRNEADVGDSLLLTRRGADLNELSPSVDSASDSTSVDGTSLRSVGVIQVSEEVLGYGGHGTVVYRGKLDGRHVAVKRMLKTYHASADREISLLIESDGHANVVRYFLKELRGDFVYLALELCDMSVQDLIVALSKRKAMLRGEGWQVVAGSKQKPSCETREPFPEATKSMLFQIASGVKHLHSLRIVHRDLKPANILLAQPPRKDGRIVSDTAESTSSDVSSDGEEDPFYAAFLRDEYIPKISDMGLGKQLAGQSSFGLSTLGNPSLLGHSGDGGSNSNLAGAGPGSVGWQAPEVMAMRWSPESTVPASSLMPYTEGSESMTEASPINVTSNTRTSRSVDIFSLGCIFYCTILPGMHPFGEWYEREANIMKNNPSKMEELEDISADAVDLVKSMINREPKLRPTAAQVCEHPLFWQASKRLAFLCDFSDRLEADSFASSSASSNTEGSSPSPSCPPSLDVFKVEREAARVVGMGWDKVLDPDLIYNVSKFRTYDPCSVRDCLRIIRNKHHHYDELPPHVKSRIGPNPDGLLRYFESKFPRLVMHCYDMCRTSLKSDDCLASKYGIPTQMTQHSEAFLRRLDTLASSVSEGSKQPPAAASLAIAKKPMSNEVDASASENNPFALLRSSTTTVSDMMSDTEAEVSNEAGAEVMVENECLKSRKGISIGDDAIPPLSTVGEDDLVIIENDKCTADTSLSFLPFASSPTENSAANPAGIVIWEGSNAAKSFQCRGWMRSDEEWTRRTDSNLLRKALDANVARCADDPKFRTRLCNHWDSSGGTFCPMRKKNKCVFAHGPVELRVKEGKKHRWGKLVDKNGNSSNPCASGGEDTYGTARSIESMRKEEGKWNTNRSTQGKGRNTRGRQGAGKKR